MGFLIQSTKTELKLFRDNSVESFFEISKALVSKRMLESLVQAYDVSEDPSKTPETSEKTEKIPKPTETVKPDEPDETEKIPKPTKPVETAKPDETANPVKPDETTTTEEGKEPEEKPEPEETKPTKKRRTTK